MVQEVLEQQCENVCAEMGCAELAPPVCLQKEVVCSNFDEAKKTCSSWEEKCRSTTQQCKRQECKRYERRCSGQRWAYKLLPKENIRQSGRVIQVPILPIGPGESAKVLLRYRLHDATKKLVAYSFTFESLNVPVETENLRVAVNVDQNLILAGVGAERSFGIMPFGAATELASMSRIDIKGGDYQTLFSRIQYAGGLVEERRNLPAGDTLIISGKYAAGTVSLYFFEILFGIALFIVLGALWLQRVKHLGEKASDMPSAQQKDLREFHIWRAIGFSAISFFSFFFLIAIQFFVKMAYVKAVFVAFAFLALTGVLYYVKKIHSTKELLAAIGFFFVWLLTAPVLVIALLFFLAIIGAIY